MTILLKGIWEKNHQLFFFFLKHSGLVIFHHNCTTLLTETVLVLLSQTGFTEHESYELNTVPPLTPPV